MKLHDLTYMAWPPVGADIRMHTYNTVTCTSIRYYEGLPAFETMEDRAQSRCQPVFTRSRVVRGGVSNTSYRPAYPPEQQRFTRFPGYNPKKRAVDVASDMQPRGCAGWFTIVSPRRSGLV